MQPLGKDVRDFLALLDKHEIIDRRSLAVNKRAFGRAQDLADAENLEADKDVKR